MSRGRTGSSIGSKLDASSSESAARSFMRSEFSCRLGELFDQARIEEFLEFHRSLVHLVLDEERVDGLAGSEDRVEALALLPGLQVAVEVQVGGAAHQLLV